MRPSLFAQAMEVRQTGDGVFQGELSQHWTIGPKVHGGAMLALCAAGARAVLAPPVQPIAVSASFLSARTPVRCGCTRPCAKRGAQSVWSTSNCSGGQPHKPCVHAVVTLGRPEHRAPPLLAVNPVVGLLDPEPPPDVASIGPGHPMAGLVDLAAGCDVRPLMSTVPMGPKLGEFGVDVDLDSARPRPQQGGAG